MVEGLSTNPIYLYPFFQVSFCLSLAGVGKELLFHSSPPMPSTSLSAGPSTAPGATSNREPNVYRPNLRLKIKEYRFHDGVVIQRRVTKRLVKEGAGEGAGEEGAGEEEKVMDIQPAKPLAMATFATSRRAPGSITSSTSIDDAYELSRARILVEGYMSEKVACSTRSC